MKSFIKILRDFLFLIFGGVFYLVCRKNTNFAYQAMIRLFCLTRGRSSDALAYLISKVCPKRNFEAVKGVMGDLSREEIRNIGFEIEKNGYYIFPKLLPADVCEKLLNLAMKTRADVRAMDDQMPNASVIKKNILYNRGAPEGIRYDYRAEDLLEDSVVQSLITDQTVISIANEYLNTTPILDIVAMWWHTSFSKHPDSNAAQLYHFDMDRIKWLKFFFYLTDCTAENGPHCFIAKSHKSGALPTGLLKKGYSRLTDEEVVEYFPKENFMEFVAPQGTILIEDTRGLHKGKHVESGDRLIFQIEFTSSMFGSPDICQLKIDPQKSANKGFLDIIKQQPRIFKNIRIS